MTDPRRVALAPKRAAPPQSAAVASNDAVDHGGPIIEISNVFNYQSFFDSTQLEKAILSQAPTELIVSSTLQEIQTPGYAISMSPDSETPVAVLFLAGQQTGKSQVYPLLPGQTIRPLGQFAGKKFRGFRWGLPFGWLGGGKARIQIHQTPDSKVRWESRAEVMFHRSRFAIQQPASMPDGSTTFPPFNWPMRFPWANAKRGGDATTPTTPLSSPFPQTGQPTMAISQPTKILLALRGATALAAPAAFRMIFYGSNEFSTTALGAADETNQVHEDFIWPSFGQGGAPTTSSPVLTVSDQAASRLGADGGGVVFEDLSGTAALSGLFVDVVRYGRF